MTQFDTTPQKFFGFACAQDAEVLGMRHSDQHNAEEFARNIKNDILREYLSRGNPASQQLDVAGGAFKSGLKTVATITDAMMDRDTRLYAEPEVARQALMDPRTIDTIIELSRYPGETFRRIMGGIAHQSLDLHQCILKLENHGDGPYLRQDSFPRKSSVGCPYTAVGATHPLAQRAASWWVHASIAGRLAKTPAIL